MDEESTCCCTFKPGSGIVCSFDIFSVISVVCLMIGLALITIGYAIPRDYKFDPHKPARVMEAIENEYARKRFALNVCIMVGTGFVTFSGLIISFIVTWELCSSENGDNDPMDPEQPCKPPSYGSVVAGSGAMAHGAAATATAATAATATAVTAATAAPPSAAPPSAATAAAPSAAAPSAVAPSATSSSEGARNPHTGS